MSVDYIPTTNTWKYPLQQSKDTEYCVLTTQVLRKSKIDNLTRCRLEVALCDI